MRTKSEANNFFTFADGDLALDLLFIFFFHNNKSINNLKNELY